MNNSRYAALPDLSDADSQGQVAGRRPFRREHSNDDESRQRLSGNNRTENETELNIASTLIGSRQPETHGLGIVGNIGRPSIKKVPVANNSNAMEGLLSPTMSNNAHTTTQHNPSLKGAGIKSPEWQTPSNNSSFSHLGPPTPNAFNSTMGLLGPPHRIDGACPTNRDILTSPW